MGKGYNSVVERMLPTQQVPGSIPAMVADVHWELVRRKTGRTTVGGRRVNYGGSWSPVKPEGQPRFPISG